MGLVAKLTNTFGLVVATTSVHGLLTGLLIRLDNNRSLMDWCLADSLRPILFIAITMLMALAAVTLEIGIWAPTYLRQGALPGWEAAHFLSSVTYATLGYGDIILSEHWLLLGCLEALVGGLMTGWSTAWHRSLSCRGSSLAAIGSTPLRVPGSMRPVQ